MLHGQAGVQRLTNYADITHLVKPRHDTPEVNGSTASGAR
jgi:hypothetical protein